MVKTVQFLIGCLLVGAITAVFSISFTAIMLGYCRLGKIVGSIPYPVMGGFLAATGYLLLTRAISMLLDRNISMATLPSIWGWYELQR